MTDTAVSAWLTALLERHQGPFTRSEFLKAVRALSARYVEQRHRLGDRSPLDSAGKRAAFASFYAPLHFITTDLIVRPLRLDADPLDEIVDFGCGTGVAGAAWALACKPRPSVEGIDRDAWALAEARWNWAHLGLRGHARRANMVDDLLARVRRRVAPDLSRTGIICGWSVNELDEQARSEMLPGLVEAAGCGARILLIEPIATSATPWWPSWKRALPNARSDEWRFDADLSRELAALSEEAGFQRGEITARSLSVSRKP